MLGSIWQSLKNIFTSGHEAFMALISQVQRIEKKNMLEWHTIDEDLAQNPIKMPSVIENEERVPLSQISLEDKNIIFKDYLDVQKFDIAKKLLQFDIGFNISDAMKNLVFYTTHEECYKIRERYTNNPIHFSHENTLDMMSVLLEKGADLTYTFCNRDFGEISHLIKDRTLQNYFRDNNLDELGLLDMAVMTDSKRATRLLLELGASPQQMHPQVKSYLLKKLTDATWREIFINHYEELLMSVRPRTLCLSATKCLFEFLNGKEEISENKKLSDLLPKEVLTLYRETPQREQKRKRANHDTLAFYETNLQLDDAEKERLTPTLARPW